MTWWLIPALIGASWIVLEIAAQCRRHPVTVLLRAAPEPCGCLRLEGGLVLPCAAHDPAAEPPVEQWAAEIGEEL